MRIIVDTNIAFSAILNTNSKIGKIILHPKSKCNPIILAFGNWPRPLVECTT